MGWYFRKAVSFGPVRLNLSKSGIGASVGVKGFRYGVRPNGRRYVHAGRYGIYYRQELDNTQSAHAMPASTSLPPATVEYRSEAASSLTTDKQELLAQLNEAYRGFRWDYLTAAVGVAVCWLAYLNYPGLLLIPLVLGIAATVAVARWETGRRTVSIDYDGEGPVHDRFKQLVAAFNHLAASYQVWQVHSRHATLGLHHFKHNAGVGEVVKRASARLGEGKPPWVDTNVSVPVMVAGGLSLYWMPDGVLVYDREGVGFLGYEDIQVQNWDSRFVENEMAPPGDARVVEYTWQHPNKTGGPDRRFASNRQIPVCLYGVLHLQSGTGMALQLMTSSPGAAMEFANSYQRALAAAQDALQFRADETPLQWLKRVNGLQVISGFSEVDAEALGGKLAQTYPPQVGEMPDAWLLRVKPLAESILRRYELLQKSATRLREQETALQWAARLGPDLCPALFQGGTYTDPHIRERLIEVVSVIPPIKGETAYQWGRRVDRFMQMAAAE